MAERLLADFQKSFPGGPVIRVHLCVELDSAPILVLFGPSGSGKTTALRCLAGLERPDRGEIRLGADAWFDSSAQVFVPPQGRRIGYLFQGYALFPHLTVEDNIAFGLRRLRQTERRQRVYELMRLLGMEELKARFPHELSGGQAQRVALARTLAPRPRLLLLDEPLSALDAPAREQLRRELRGLLLSSSLPAVVVTHDRLEALSVGDQMAVLIDGEVRQCGPVEEVFTTPWSVEVAKSVGVENILPARVAEAGADLITLQAGSRRLFALGPARAGEEVFACIRAEEVILERGESARVSARNRLAGRVVRMQPEGPLVRVTLDCGIKLTALVTRQTLEEFQLQEGMQVTALIKAPAIHLIARGS